MPATLRFLALALVLVVAGCAGAPKNKSGAPGGGAASSPGGGYYKDDGPGDRVPADLGAIPEPVPRAEPLHRFANRPYIVFGREYVPATSLRPYREQGVASWYGRKFHGAKTSTGEIYDMYALTAAHPTLPLPSFARVTSVATGSSVIVRVNDRGPFLHDRLIDLSYAAAARIGIEHKGSGMVVVESILPGAANVIAAPLPPVAAPPQPAVQAEPIAVQPAGGGFSVQLGAFASNANARIFLDRVQNQLATAGVEARIRAAGGLYRVYVGPYSDREGARRAAADLESAFGLTTAVAPH